MDQLSMWIINKCVTASPSDGGSARIPTLKVKTADGETQVVANNEGKSKALYNSFFYPPLDDPGIDPNHVYHLPRFQPHNISNKQIHHAIKKLKPYEAPGPDSISNSVFTHCADLLVPWLGKLFRATFHLKYYPEEWKIYDTTVLRKPGKPDYWYQRLTDQSRSSKPHPKSCHHVSEKSLATMWRN